MHTYDVTIIGAGAAGLFCAGVAGQLGLRVLLIDHAPKVAEKIRISGGGRCNFTNRDLDPRQPQKHFLGDNPHFCRSALSRYTPNDFIELLQRHGVPFHEKHKGQLFCDRSAQDLIDVLLRECDAGQVQRWQPCSVKQVRSTNTDGGQRYELDTDEGTVTCRSVVVATGGLPVPKIGATDFGLRLAKQFGLGVVETRPALVPLTFDGTDWAPFADLAGLALPVRMETGEKKQRAEFLEDLLFTHRGLSGPAVLQISSYWRPGQPLRVDLHPDEALEPLLQDAKARSRKLLANELAQHLPARLADAWTQRHPQWQRPVNEASDKALAELAQGLHRWQITPTGTEGYAKAEVMAGGVDTRQLSSQTMESRQPGLYFIGEVVDVTGWLGGYNFQWAWASAYACAQALAAEPRG
ncbi:BaiN/RdsA family NAD(P)/FAD-dependent oxidoreductase [Hydrogenophaga aquatica]